MRTSDRTAAKWRRRAAAMRMFHALGWASAIIGSLISLRVLFRKPIAPAAAYGVAQRPGAPALPVASGVVTSGVIAVSLLVSWARIWRLKRDCELGQYGKPLDTSAFGDLEALRDRIKDFTGDVEIAFQVAARDRAPRAQVIRAQKVLNIFLNFSALNPLNATTMGAVWHEVAHHVQWDTSVGRWMLGLNRLIGICCLVIALPAGGLLSYDYLVLLKAKETANPGLAAVWGVEYVALLGVALMLLVYFGARFWRHFCEHNCDILTVLAGYGPQVVSELRRDSAPKSLGDRWTRFWEWLTGFYPTRRSRVAFLEKLSSQYSAAPSMKGLLPIRLGDYVLGLVLYIIPIAGFFSAASVLYTRWALQVMVEFAKRYPTI